MKKSKPNDLSVLYKVIIPVSLIFIFLCVSFLIYFQHGLVKKDIDKKLRKNYQLITTYYHANLEKYHEKFSVAALALANNPHVFKAIESYYIDSLAEMMASEVSKAIQWIEPKAEKDVKIHIHRYDGISFYRSWSHVNGDNLHNIPSIAKTYADQNAVSGIETRAEGPVIFTVQPVYNEEGIMLGSVEVFVNFQDLLNDLNDSINNITSLLVSKNNWQKIKNDQVSAGVSGLHDFVAFDDYFREIKSENIDEERLGNALLNAAYFLQNEFGYNLMPLMDFQKQTIGVIINQEDFSDFLSYYSNLKLKMGASLAIILILSLLILFISLRKTITEPLYQILKSLNALALGEHNRRIKIKTNDEIGKIKRAINHVNESLINVEYFAHEIGEGKLNATFKPRSKKDTLAQTLIDMRDKLQKTKEDADNRRKTEKIREWQTEGISELNKILRTHSNDTSELFYHVIGNLVKYIDANQGGIFILDDEQKQLELKSCYAYDRNKYMEKKVDLKEGLIGRCFQEKESINLSEIPGSYMKIVSAVGEKSPDHLLLVPLMHDDKVKGVIELASFKKFEEHVVGFVQEICQPLSLALNDIEYSERTKRLLDESKDKEQRLVQQEEEMRQNMEELKSTQEQMERRERELLDRIAFLESK